MEQRLRLVQGGQQPRADKRISERRAVAVPGQIVWKDARGTTRMASVVTRDVSEHGVSVECLSGEAIPLYRLVYFQIDREARNRPDLPAALRKSNVLSAITTSAPSARQPAPRPSMPCDCSWSRCARGTPGRNLWRRGRRRSRRGPHERSRWVPDRCGIRASGVGRPLLAHGSISEGRYGASDAHRAVGCDAHKATA